MSKFVQDIRILTNNHKDSVCRINVKAVTFSDLWTSYPGGHPYKDPKTGRPPKGYEDQCAINLSAAIHGSGIAMKSFKGATVAVDEKRMAVRAQELATWLKLQPFCGLPQHPQDVTGVSWDEKSKESQESFSLPIIGRGSTRKRLRVITSIYGTAPA